MFHSEREAKRFFVERILARARTENLCLSEAEQQMLSWSESDPDFKPDPSLVDRLASELSDEEYEAKVSGLLERSYWQDVEASGDAYNTYREAYALLGQSDHYVLVMIKRALGRRLRPWWAFWR